MNKRNDSAFPWQVGTDIHEGMTLRDYFAAKAMQAMITGSISYGQPFNSKTQSEDMGDAAYRVADGMIEARGK